MITKQARHFAIKQIISTRPVSNQDGLRLELRKRGFRVTQATLSRDLKVLGVGRIATGEGAKYVLQPAAEAQILQPVVGAEVISISCNENVVVVKTLPGCAGAVGEFLDALSNEDIIGTLAGDNTILVVPQSQKKTKNVMQFLEQKLFEEQS